MSDTKIKTSNISNLAVTHALLHTDMDLTSKTVQVAAPSSNTHPATKLYVDTEVANLIDSAPGTLDTLNELAAAINDDANFNATIASSIATKLPLSGGTLTGNLTLTSTASGSSASPEFELRRDITGADANYIGQIKFTADNDADQNTVFAKITGKILDASDGTEDGIIEFAHKKAGSNNISARFRSDSLQLINGTNLTVAGTTELTGNVGIGTGSSVTNSTLNVNGGINITTGIIGYATNDSFTLNGRTQPHYGCNFTGSSGNPSGISGYYGISFAANGAEKMRITSSGNVGIGATGRIMSGYDGNSKTLTVYDPDGSAQSGYLELASMANNNGYNAGALVFINNANSNNSAPENANSKTVAQIRAETVTSDNNADDDAGSDLCIFTKPEAGGLQRRMTIMGSGNVGIGTNGPGAKLSVSGPAALANLGGGSTGSAALYVNSTSGHVGELIQILKNGATKMHMANDGKLGIGTQSPQEKLEVNGVLQIRRDGDHPALRFAEINSGTTTTRGYIASGDWAVNGGAIDDFGISGSVSGDLLFATNAGAERLRIQNSTGNVGIGTTSPDAKLHVNGAAIIGSNTNQATTPIAGLHVIDNTYSHWHPTLSKNQIALRVETYWNASNGQRGAGKYGSGIGFNHLGGHSATHDENVHAWVGLRVEDTPSHERSNLVFATNNDVSDEDAGILERMCITPPGNVGIGTKEPTATLQVEGNQTSNPVARFKGTAASDNPVLTIETHDNNRDPHLRFVRPNGTSGASMVIRGGSGSDWLSIHHLSRGADDQIVIKHNGNIGIGTNSPSQKLHVVGNIVATGNVTAYSDISLKDNITSIPDALDKVLQIRGVTYNRNDIEDNPLHTGVIAQEVEKVLPEVISENEDGIKSVAYGNMVGLLVEAIKELKAEIEELKGK